MTNKKAHLDLRPVIIRKHTHFLFYSALLFIFTAIVYGLNFSPALYYDDWGQFAYKFFTGNLQWFIPNYVRPLSFATYRLETELFGMSLAALMIFRIFMLFIQGLLFFIILEKLQVFSSLLNFICSLVILFSPIDMTRMWLVVEPLRLIFVQIYMVSMIFYLEKKSITAFIIGLVFGFVSILNYEAQLGLILFFPISLFILHLFKEKKRNWLLLLPLFIGFTYLLFRTFGSLIGIENFHSSQSITLIYLLRQIRNGLVCHVTGWFNPLSTDVIIRNIFIVVMLLSLVFYIFHLIKYGFEKDYRKRSLHAFILFGIGYFFWLAGYFPWIAYGIPSYMDYFSSRAHNFSIPGAVICLLAIIEFLGSIIQISNNRKQVISAALALPFLVIGAMSQMAIQKETKLLWNDYHVMWKGIFEKVPNIKDNAHVVLVISPDINELRYGEKEYFTSASFNVEISSALAIFYANDTLEGEFMYKNVELIDTPTLHEDGIKNPPTYSGTIPYSDIIFIEFDRVTKNVHVVRDLEKEFGIANPSYNVDRFISKEPMTRNSLRYIITE